MRKTVLSRMAEGSMLVGLLMVGMGIGVKQGAQAALVKQYTLPSRVYTLEERREIGRRASEEAAKEFPIYERFLPAAIFWLAGVGFSYVDSRRERKKREWNVYASSEPSR